jgi:hypothetical protein
MESLNQIDRINRKLDLVGSSRKETGKMQISFELIPFNITEMKE